MGQPMAGQMPGQVPPPGGFPSQQMGMPPTNNYPNNTAPMPPGQIPGQVPGMPGQMPPNSVPGYPPQTSQAGFMANNVHPNNALNSSFNNLKIQAPADRCINLLQERHILPEDGVETVKPNLPQDFKRVNCSAE